MKILISGDRNWDDPIPIINAFEKVCLDYKTEPQDIILVHGDAKGADTLASIIGMMLGMDVKPYPAHWSHTDECLDGCREMVGRPAGPIRNKRMLGENTDITLGILFHSNLEKSKGTADMKKRLEKDGIEVIHIKGNS